MSAAATTATATAVSATCIGSIHVIVFVITTIFDMAVRAPAAAATAVVSV